MRDTQETMFFSQKKATLTKDTIKDGICIFNQNEL